MMGRGAEAIELRRVSVFGLIGVSIAIQPGNSGPSRGPTSRMSVASGRCQSTTVMAGVNLAPAARQRQDKTMLRPVRPPS